MDDEELPGRPGRCLEPAHEPVGVSMSRKAMNRLDAGTDGNDFAEHLEGGRPFLEEAAPRSLGLIADQQDGGIGIGQPELEVMEHPSPGRHAARRDDEHRAPNRIDGLGFFRRPREPELA